MSGRSPRQKALWSGLLCLLLLASGCGRPSRPSQSGDQRRIQLLAILYVRYGAGERNQGKSPPSEKAFKEFINQLSPQELKGMSITDVDALFTSPRDNMPYVVNYNLKGAPPGGAPKPGGVGPKSGGEVTTNEPAGAVLVYEKMGSGGKRYVAFATGQVELVDAARARELKIP